MARPKNPVPAYKKHPTKNEARCWVDRRWLSLGEYGSEKSRREYERVCAEVRETDAKNVRVRPKRRELVADVCVAFMEFAITHYRDINGTITGEVSEYRTASTPLLEMHSETPAVEFGPLALQAVRQRMIDKGWCRTRVNKQVGRIRRIFKWAASQELVPASLPHGLACVQGLQRGRTIAPESKPVGAVDRATVEKTLPRLDRHQQTMVKLQLFTGMRPGEVTRMTMGQIVKDGDQWAYCPDKHKSQHHGKTRVIVLGPRAKELIVTFLGDRQLMPEECLFNPRIAREERFEVMRSKRKTKVQPSQQKPRRKINPKRTPGEEYSVKSYCHAVYHAAKRAGADHWHPNQLRHTFATEVRKQFGLEAAQVLLGHSKADVTQIYAERNMGLAMRVATEIG